MAAPLAFEQPSINKAWQAFLQHIPVFVVIYLGTVVFTLLGFVIYFAIVMIAAAASGGNSDAALSFATVLGQLAQLPFSLITSLLSVLIVAVPALFYERGEVVTIEAAWQLVIGRFWRYLLGMARNNPALLEQFLSMLAHNEHFLEYRSIVQKEIHEQLESLPPEEPTAAKELQPA